MGLFDESSFAKIEIAGPGAAEFLERLCDNRVARDVGKITYTQMLNYRGGIECDFTVARLEEDRFSIVTGTAFGNHDLGWMRRHLPEDGAVRLADVTAQWSCLALWGPRARGPGEMERAADELPIEQVAKRWVVASRPEEVVEALRVYTDLGFDHLVVHGPGHDQERFLSTFAEQVLPGLRELTPAPR